MRMKKLKLLGKSLLLAAGLTAFAAQAASIDVRLSDGSLLSVEMQDQMSCRMYLQQAGDVRPLHLTLSTGEVTITQDGLVPYEGSGNPGIVWLDVELEKISDVQFNNLSTGIAAPVASGAHIHLNDGVLSVSGVKSPIGIKVTDLRGINIHASIIDTDTVIDLNNFGSGMYLVKIGSETLKIMVK